MAKLLFVGDPHLKISKFELSCRFLAWIGEVVETTRPDYVINLGDTFDTHSVVRSEIMGEFKKHVLQVTRYSPYIYVLGNHDMFKPNDSKYHALEVFKDIDSFTVIDERRDMLGISFVPFIPDNAVFPKDTLPICVAHQTFIGADFGLHRPDVGVESEAVSAEIIISGHIHKRQSFGKVIYPGTPFSQNADDVDQSKGVMLFDSDTYEYRFIECPLPRWRSMKFEITQDISISDIHASIVGEINSADNWLIKIDGPKAEIVAYMNSKDMVKLSQRSSIRVIPTYTDKDKQLKVKIRSSSMNDIVFEYVDKVYQGSIDKSIVKSKALELLTKVRST